MKKGILIWLCALICCLYSHTSSAQSCVGTISYTDSGSTYFFSALGSFYPGSTFAWHYGDGSYGYGQTATHTYATGPNSSFQVSLSVSDSLYGCLGSFSYDTVYPPGYTSCFTSVYSTNIDTVYTLSTYTSGTGPFTYLWHLPNGDTSTSATPVCTIYSTGTYTAWVIVTGSACVDTGYISLTYSYSGQSCQATISYTADSGTTYTFYANGYFYPGSQFTWDFGDGTYGYSEDMMHTYSNLHTLYTIHLTVTDSAYSCSYSTSDSLYQGGNRCSSYVTSSSMDSLFSLGTYNTGVAPFTYYWQLPGGGNSTAANPTCILPSPGYYSGWVIVTDSTGCIDTATAALNYSIAGACAATITYTDSGASYSFTANGSFSPYAQFWWNFGDGTGSAGQVVSHTYGTNYEYLIQLTVSDSINNCVSYTTDSVYPTGGHAPCSSVIYSGIILDSLFSLNTENTGVAPFSYTWYLPSGMTTVDSPTCILPGFGNYSIEAVVLDANGCIDTAFTTISYPGSAGCTASISYSDSGVRYTFGAVGNFNSWTQFAWSFGDGTGGSGQYVTHYYPGGTNTQYIVELTVTDSALSCSYTAFDSVSVNGSPARCSSTINTTNIDTLFTLSTTNTGVGPFTYSWWFSTGATSTLPNPTYLIGSTGNWNATVIVTDSTGCMDTTSITLNYANYGGGGACQAYFYVIPDSVTGNYTAVEVVSGTGPFSYMWSFGDGDTSSLQYPTHTYTVPGFYTPCLTISNGSCTSTYCDSSFYAYKTGGGPMSGFNVISRSAALGIQNVDANTLLSIYPNPAKSVLELHLKGNDKIEQSIIYNTTGQKVAAFGSSAQLSIDGLAAGMYIIEVKTSNGSLHSSFVKQD